METNFTMPTPAEHARRFRETHKGKGLTDAQIDEICDSILSSGESNEKVPYYRANLISAIFYINVMINCNNNTPSRFRKSFVGHCGGLSIPGDSLYDGCDLYTCGSYSFEDIFSKQTAIEVDAESIICFIRFFDKDSHLLGYLMGAGAGSVVGVMGGTGRWKDGPLVDGK